MTENRRATIVVNGQRGQVSADGYRVGGIHITPTMREALAIAKVEGAVLAPPVVLDARWEAADLKNNIHTQKLQYGQDDAQLQSWRIDEDIRAFVAEFGREPAIVGNACKSWTQERPDGVCELYGLFVPAERVTFKGGRYWGDGLPVYRSESDETDAYIVQRSRDSNHNAAHHDYYTGLILWWPDNISQAPDTIPSAPPCWHDGVALADLALGERCCLWLGYQYGLAPREIPGPKHDPIILSYSEHCRRGGHLLGVRADGAPRWDGGAPLALRTDDSDSPWCAALASETLRNALLPSEPPPHGLRVSVRELVEDARIADMLRPVHWRPTPGSLAILGRDGHDPLIGGSGHVRCSIQLVGEKYLGIGGNEADTVTCGWHPLADVGLRAWIER